jgi:hypothetical protein
MNQLLEKAQQQLDKRTRGILDPHFEVIATLRRKNWTFKEIADFLNKEGIRVSMTWVNQYWVAKNGPSKNSGRKRTPELKKTVSQKKHDPLQKPEPNCVVPVQAIQNLPPEPPKEKKDEKKVFEFKEFEQSDWEELHQLRAKKKN